MMKQLALHLRTGKILLMEVPIPIARRGCLLIKTRKSLISAGTERMLVGFSKASLLSKAILAPEKLNLVMDKIRSDGFRRTLLSVSGKLDELIPLGYCQTGEVIEVGEGVQGYRVGDRVVSNGCHAQIVCIPVNLVAPIPENVDDDNAVFTVQAAVALHGIRLLAPALGEAVAVIGLGLIGLLTAELLRINGCNVLGIEPDKKRAMLAIELGFQVFSPDEIESSILSMYKDGVDGVIITASSSANSIINQAARISRKKGKIVLVGAVGLNLVRNEFYKKELNFQVSCSYGPGRYDDQYEEKGIDYPIPYVRWTENRNFQAVLELLKNGRIEFRRLISEVIALENIASRYQEKISTNVATVIDYPSNNSVVARKYDAPFCVKGSNAVLGIIGAGNFVRMTLLPNLKGACIKYIASARGLNAADLSQKYRIPHPVSDYHAILDDKNVDLVLIATRHDQHGSLVKDALQAGKHVFVEKPLTIFEEELDQIIEACQLSGKTIAVGFNRRFSPYILEMKTLLNGALMNVTVTVNAGYLPAASWLKDRAIGGGRILGEACHFIDLISCITESPIIGVCSNALSAGPRGSVEDITILIRCLNGSAGVVNYFSNGNSRYQKERVEVYSMGKTIILDDFRRLTYFGFNRFSRPGFGKDKGHKNQFSQLVQSVKNGGAPLIPFSEIINTTKATFAAMESLAERKWVVVQ
jgi:predicted dehydrogenase/threonine dehydrogenase-like Zn-dependent dehydrogenase